MTTPEAERLPKKRKRASSSQGSRPPQSPSGAVALKRKHQSNSKRGRATLPFDHAAATKKRLELLKVRRTLPVWSAREKYLELASSNRVLITIGETGSGKTTQIPQFLHAAGYAKRGMIAVTQPRRVAAVTVAKRVAEEMGVQLGQQVGYSVRFDDATSPATAIKYMTDGMLLREALIDPQLSRYSVVVLDEVHERTVQTDVLMALLKQLSGSRGDDFLLVAMSATLDAAKFSSYFQGSALAYIEGRSHPVAQLYTPSPQDSYLDAAVTTVLQLHQEEPPGDILCFLTGQEEIESVERLLCDRIPQLPPADSGLQLLPLPIYAQLPPEQQMKVFEPPPDGARKVVLATNIAETSVTIPGITVVVDTGVVKVRAFAAKLGVESLQVAPVSQAQARQRAGRAGREAPGKCFRLFTEATARALPPATAPEIVRCNMATVVLQLKAMGVHDVAAMDFLDPPNKGAVSRALELLYALGALDRGGKLVDPVGRLMARLPVEPMFAKVLLAACDMGCLREAMGVVAMVSTDAVWVTPRAKEKEAAAARVKFHDPSGDHLTLLHAFSTYEQVPAASQYEWCHAHFLNVRSMRKAAEIFGQLRSLFEALEVPIRSLTGCDLTPLRRALVAGLFPHAARLQPDGSYVVMSSNQPVKIHPGSMLCGRAKTPCLVFNQQVHTSQRYIRECTAVDLQWLPELAPVYYRPQPMDAKRL